MMQGYVTGEQNEQVQAGSPPRQPLWHGCNQQRAPTNSEINSIETVAQRIHTAVRGDDSCLGSIVVVVPLRNFSTAGDPR